MSSLGNVAPIGAAGRKSAASVPSRGIAHAVIDTDALDDVYRFHRINGSGQAGTSHEPPTRTTIGCELSGILVEIDCVAYVRHPEDG